MVWSNWKSIDVRCETEKPGVYKIRLSMIKDTPAKISRLLGRVENPETFGHRFRKVSDTDSGKFRTLSEYRPE